MSAPRLDLPRVQSVRAMLGELPSRERRKVVRRVRLVLRALLGLRNALALTEAVLGPADDCPESWEVRDALLQLSQDTLSTTLDRSRIDAGGLPALTDSVLLVLTGQTAPQLGQTACSQSPRRLREALRHLRQADGSLREPT